MSILKSGLARAREAGSAEQVSERDAFEKWAMPDGMQARTDAEGNYCDVGMSAGWSAWQARAALQHTAPAPSDELERLRGHLTLMPEDEAAFPDAFNVAVIRIDRYWQLREAEEKATAPSKAGEWNAAIEAAAKFVKGRLAGRAEGSDLWLEVGKIERGIRALSSAPAQAAQSEKGGEA
ncbi:MAG TPA: hypothetical protein VJ652_14985 [Noviherbaspirillum sp.]|nr:hypothetical protein [Noviherbaspirillum sp.]